ncbi:hypothetical protein Hanom_Chr11g01036781 [Helianthus anomalus]
MVYGACSRILSVRSFVLLFAASGGRKSSRTSEGRWFRNRRHRYLWQVKENTRAHDLDRL